MSLNTNIVNLQEILNKVNNLPEVGSYPEITINIELNEKTYINMIEKVSIINGQIIDDYSYPENKIHTHSIKIPAGTYFRILVDTDDYNYRSCILSPSTNEAFMNLFFGQQMAGSYYGCPIKNVTITGGYIYD